MGPDSEHFPSFWATVGGGVLALAAVFGAIGGVQEAGGDGDALSNWWLRSALLTAAIGAITLLAAILAALATRGSGQRFLRYSDVQVKAHGVLDVHLSVTNMRRPAEFELEVLSLIAHDAVGPKDRRPNTWAARWQGCSSPSTRILGKQTKTVELATIDLGQFVAKHIGKRAIDQGEWLLHRAGEPDMRVSIEHDARAEDVLRVWFALSLRLYRVAPPAYREFIVTVEEIYSADDEPLKTTRNIIGFHRPKWWRRAYFAVVPGSEKRHRAHLLRRSSDPEYKAGISGWI